MAQSSEIKLNKRFDQNIEITGNLTVGGTVSGFTDTNYYLDGITKSGNTLTFSVNGATNQTYTFGSAAFANTTDFAAASHTHSYLPLSGGNLSGNLNIIKNNVGVITNYSAASIEANDAQLDIISSSAGTWGSAINLVEGTSSTANTNVWSIARQTSGVGNLLRFNFGTGNQHDNAAMMSLSTGGNLTLTGTLSASGYNKSNWDTAYGWGNHADANYLTTVPSGYVQNTDDFFKPITEIPSSANLNSYRSTGYASQNTNSHAAAGTNYPTPYAGILEVINDDTGNGVHTVQRYSRYASNDVYTRYYYNGGWQSWARFLTTEDEGSGNGLDADTVDGYHETSFFRSDLGQIGNSDIAFGATTGFPNQPRSGAYKVDHVGYSSTLAVFNSSGSANTAALQFHYNGDMYVHVNIDGSQWQSDRVWTSQNDGSGSGLDADLWDGNQFSSYLNQAVLTTSNPTFNNIYSSNLYVSGYIYHNGDTNTYIRFVGGDDFQIVSGGRQVLRMDEGTDPDKLELGDSSTYVYTSGRIGVNTSTPTQDLHVVGSALFGESSDVTYDAPIKIRNSADGFIGMVRTGVRTWAHNIGANGHYYLRNVDGTYNVFEITDDNKVGIGKTPSYQLDVNASIRAGDNLYIGTGGGFFYNDSGSRIRTNYDFYTNNSNTYLYATNLYLGAGSGDNVQVRGNRMYGNNWEIDTDGSAGFGTTSAGAQVHIVDNSFPQLRINDDTGGGEAGMRIRSFNGTSGLHCDIFSQMGSSNETGYLGFRVPWNGYQKLRLHSNGSLSLGIPGNGQNNGGRYLSFEGNTDGSGEGSGRLFFTEHNSTTASMDNYGMSIGYRGGGTSVTTAGGNTWTGLSQIGNGQWGMWGHDNNLAGNLIMFGDRQATYVDFAGNNIQGITDIYVADQIIHTGDTDTYLQFHGANLFRVVIAGGEVTEWGNNYMKMRDGDTFRMGEGSDFRQWHDGTNHYFRNYHHAGGNIYFQSEGTGGVNHALIYMYGDTARPYVVLYEDSVERLRTVSDGVDVTGIMTATADVVAYSDERVKENVKTIDNALDKVKALRGVSYNRTDLEDKSPKIGVIAQEVQKVLPEVVYEQSNEMLAVSYGNMVSVLIEAVKELSNKVEELENKLNGTEL